MLKLFRQLAFTALGSAMMAFGIINFAVANNLADGGFSGVTIILYHVFGFNTGISSFLLNLPMLFIIYRLFDKATFLLTVFGIVSLSGFLSLFQFLGPLVPNLQNDMILAVLGYGITVGGGLGLVLRENGTTGGSAVVAKVMKKIWDIPMDKTLFIFDTIVVTSSFLFFLSFENGVYTLLGLYICAKIIAKLQEGFHSGYKVMIISRHSEEISRLVQEEIGRGITLIKGVGGYSKDEKEIILTIISQKQLVNVKKIIYAIDPHSFVSVSHTYETFGEGFTFEKQRHPLKQK